MRNLLIIFFLSLCTTVTYGQFGINASYTTNDAPDWEIDFVDVNGEDIGTTSLGNGWQVGIDYWFRLPNKRIEFLPELNYGRYNYNFGSADFNNQFYSFFFNTNIYFLDLASDCDCPTFSKQSDFLQKGLFLQISPGITYLTNDYKTADLEGEGNDTSFSIGGALGLDIGLSDFVTISPIVGVRYYPGVDWNFGGSELNSSITQVHAGLRMGFRLDGDKY